MHEEIEVAAESVPDRFAETQSMDIPEQDPEYSDPRSAIVGAITGLEDLEELPLVEHVERFEKVHSELAAALSSIDKV